MSYTYMAVQTEDNDFFWSVYETATDQIIKTFVFEDDAKSYCNFLRKGGAFNGFTPAFMLIPSNIPMLDINEHFDMEFSGVFVL